MENSETYEAIANGKAPFNLSMIDAISTGSSFITDFWSRHYLDDFIRQGGSSVKFLIGRKGSGKTHTLLLLEQQAREKGYVPVYFSAESVLLNDFKLLYLQILEKVDMRQLVVRLGNTLIHNLGYEVSEIDEGSSFVSFLSDRNEFDGLMLRHFREALRRAFLENPHMDNNFAQIMSMLVSDYLGYPELEAKDRDFLLAWLHGDTSQKLTAIRAFAIAPYRITKYNARHMLRSLLEALSFAGYAGIFVAVDDLAVMTDTSGMCPVHYTKMRRDDTYESIRQLIDELDSFHHLMVVFAGRRELIDNEKYGFKSYQALWLRIQNEVVCDKVNRFSGIIDLDKAERQTFTPQMLVEMSRKLAEAVGKNLDAIAIDIDKATALLKQAKMGDVSIPLLVNQATLRNLKEKIEESATHV